MYIRRQNIKIGVGIIQVEPRVQKGKVRVAEALSRHHTINLDCGLKFSAFLEVGDIGLLHVHCVLFLVFFCP